MLFVVFIQKHQSAGCARAFIITTYHKRLSYTLNIRPSQTAHPVDPCPTADCLGVITIDKAVGPVVEIDRTRIDE